ncbi:hypothetical protein HYZ05_01705 [Candidatus Daviesbacteria bacterium]|nr:hypothetical protein [Candidatus Daviesbacteria bacterium]
MERFEIKNRADTDKYIDGLSGKKQRVALQDYSIAFELARYGKTIIYRDTQNKEIGLEDLGLSELMEEVDLGGAVDWKVAEAYPEILNSRERVFVASFNALLDRKDLQTKFLR